MATCCCTPLPTRCWEFLSQNCRVGDKQSLPNGRGSEPRVDTTKLRIGAATGVPSGSGAVALPAYLVTMYTGVAAPTLLAAFHALAVMTCVPDFAFLGFH